MAPKAFVIGHPIAHSRSPLLHGFWLEELGLPGTYERVDVAPGDLDAFVAGLAERGFVGGNVTVPHKGAVMGHAARLTEAARAVGAANTLWFEDGGLVADNTDVAGFLANLDDRAPGWDAGAGEALVLGAGGAARAAAFALLGRGFTVALVNRTRARAEALADFFGPRVGAHAQADMAAPMARASLLVNATALGMSGKPALEVDLAPLPIGAVVCDLVYVPLETDLLAAARARGNRVVDGLGMLLHQAAPGFERWFGARPRVGDALRRVLEDDIRAGTGR